MKIRCGSHQQNRSIVRPGLSLMATKVALTAEEFRENSQRSIALFNTEKLSTDSTHVLKSAYCILCISAVAICTGRVEAKVRAERTKPNVHGCNLHGACGGKGACTSGSASIRSCNLHGACGGKDNHHHSLLISAQVAICTGRVEAKNLPHVGKNTVSELQSARGVWRQRPTQGTGAPSSPRCNLHGACGGKAQAGRQRRVPRQLQSARGVWRQSATMSGLG